MRLCLLLDTNCRLQDRRICICTIIIIMVQQAQVFQYAATHTPLLNIVTLTEIIIL